MAVSCADLVVRGATMPVMLIRAKQNRKNESAECAQIEAPAV
jgi:hypothetical protein